MEKQLYLFDPQTAERKPTTYKQLSGITGRSIASLRSSKRHLCRMKILNSYIIDNETPISVLRSLLEKERIIDEVWRDIPNSRWQVSSYGRYRSRLRCQNKIVYRIPNKGNHTTSYMIGISIDGKVQMFRAHYWVVKLFIGELPKGFVIYHKDGNKARNSVENLGFIKRRELMLKQATNGKRKAIVQLDEVTEEVVAEYHSLLRAAKENFTSPQSIRQAIKENKPAIGFLWMTEEMYLEQEVREGIRG